MSPDSSRPVVLVVDDDAIMRRAFARAVSRAGCRCVEARGGAEALALFDGARDPDLVILDLNLDGENGLEVARRIAAVSPATPVLITSGAAAEQRALAPPVVGVLEKPFELRQLLEAIDRALAGTARRPRP